MKSALLSNPAVDGNSFLSGGGEMGALTRAFNWSNTSIGTPDAWPQSLKTAVALVLSSKFPMFLWWGEDLIQFYNDAYRPSLGGNGKHPLALGQKAVDCWPEAWGIIYPLISHVMQTGEATWSENQLVPISRNGKMEDVYWTFGYNPVRDEQGGVNGVLALCNETTTQVQARKHLEESENRYRTLIMETTVATALYLGPEINIQFANDTMLRYWGRDNAVFGKTFRQALPELEAQPFPALLENVYATGETYTGSEVKAYLLINGQLQPNYFNFTYKALRNSDGEVYGILHTAIDVSEQVLARNKASETEQRIRAMVDTAPFPIVVYTGEEMQIELANQAIIDMWGKGGDIIGKPYAEALPGQGTPVLFAQLKNVYATGIPFHVRNHCVHRQANGKMQAAYYNYSLMPLYNAEGAVYGVMTTAADVTDITLAKQRVEQSEANFREMILQAPVAMCIFNGPNHVVDIANERMLEFWGKNREDVIQKPIFDGLPEARGQGLEQVLENVYTTGERFAANERPVRLPRNGQIKTVYVNFVYEPRRDASGAIYGIAAVANDVTEQVTSRQKIEESALFANSVIQNSEAAQIVWLGPDMVFDMVNEKMLEILGRDRSIIGKPLLEAIPELRHTPLLQKLRQVIATGQPYAQPGEMFFTNRQARPHAAYYNYSYKPLTNALGETYGIICTASEVTELVLSKLRTEQAEQKARLAIESADLGTYEIDYATDDMVTSARFNVIWGIPHALNRSKIVGLVHPDDRAIRQQAHAEALVTGNLHYEVRLLWADLSIHWVRVKGKVVYDEAGKPKTLLGVIQDITEQKQFSEELSRQLKERTADLENKHGELKISEERYHRMVGEVEDYAIILLNSDGIIQNWNKGAEKIKGYKEEEIVGKSFEHFYLKEDREKGIPQGLIKEAAKNGKAMTEGWRVRKGNGTFWGSVVITALHDDAGNVVGFSKVTRDLTEKKMADDTLKENTRELEFQNNELEQFAYAASHDMKEPLRKIHFYASYVNDLAPPGLDSKSKEYLNRIVTSVKKMTTLVEDILTYSKTTSHVESFSNVDLKKIVKEGVLGHGEELAGGKVHIHAGQLPVVHAISFQCAQLLDNIISNAVKYKHPDRESVIHISSGLVKGSDIIGESAEPGRNYHRVSIQDNGIGFQPEYAKKIFEIFQRLNNKKGAAGAGIGLAICKKIVQNHRGFIQATGKPGEGARFDIYLPCHD